VLPLRYVFVREVVFINLRHRHARRGRL
jgi:hypothetical protein